MTVARRVAPDFTSMLPSAYKAAIDAALAVDARFGGWFAPHQVYGGSPNPDLAVELDAGYLRSGTTLTEVAAQTVSGFTIPSAGQERIDRVVVDATTGVASRVAGTAVTGSPSATAPAIPSGKIAICQVRLTDSDTAVLDSMITDERSFPAIGGATITEATPQATTSGTSKDFTGIPAGTKLILIQFVGVSWDAGSNMLVQIGDAGGIETSGYTSNCYAGGVGYVQSTAGFLATENNAAANAMHGMMILAREDSSDNTWTAISVVNSTNANTVDIGGGSKALSAELDRVRITTVGGTANGDAGEVNVSYLG